MADRIEVNETTLQAFLDARMTSDNYHLLYGLHLLSQEYYLSILDALLNNELQVEELVRLGGYTDAEAQKLLDESLGSWTNSNVYQQVANFDGYAYLSDTLNLKTILSTEIDDPLFTTSSLIGAAVSIGVSGHKDVEEVKTIFNKFILPDALAGLQLREYLPANEAEVRLLPCTNPSTAKYDMIWKWMSKIYLSFLNPSADDYVLNRILTVGTSFSKCYTDTDLAIWVSESSNPPLNFHLLLHREAARITVDGIYTNSYISNLITSCETIIDNNSSTTNAVNELAFNVLVIGAYLNVNPDSALKLRYVVLRDSLQAVYDHCTRLRGFISRILAGSARYLIGNYPH